MMLRPGRPLVQLATGLLALLLRYLGWWEALAVTGLALAIEAHVVPRLSPAAARATPPATGGFVSRSVFHPAIILLLIFLLPDRPDIVAATWGIVAFGGALAMLAPGVSDAARVAWNRERPIAGCVALFTGGAIAGAVLCWWCRPQVVPPPYMWFSIGGPIVAALLSAFVVTIPVRLDHNVAVGVTAATVLWALSFVAADLLGGWMGAALPVLPLALGANAAASFAGYWLRSVSASGAISGTIIGTLIVVTIGWRGWGLLLLSFALAVIASRIGLRRKTLLGIAEAGGGRRGAGSAWGNTGIATAAAVLAVVSFAREPALVAFVAALAAGSADTVASEIGKAFGRRTYLITTLRDVVPGASGGISLEGTAAGLLGALAIAAAAVAAGLVPPDAIAPIVLATLAGSLVESILGAIFEAPRVLNNHLLNTINTAVAAAVAVLL